MKPTRLFSALCIAWMCLLATSLYISCAYAMEFIRDVSVSPLAIDLEKSETTTISFNLTQAGQTEVFICSLSGQIVCKLLSMTDMVVGSHQVTWNGKTDNQVECISDAYIPIIRLKTPHKGRQAYNPTTQNWGEWMWLSDLSYDRKTQVLSYTVDRPAICSIRAGEKDGGPLYNMLLSWVPRDKGSYTRIWNGKDNLNHIQVASRKQFDMVAEGFTLPLNSILVTGSTTQAYDSDIALDRFALCPPHGTNISNHAMHNRIDCKPIPLRAEITNAFARKDDQPMVKDKIVIDVNLVDTRRKDRLFTEVFEVCLYMDGRFIAEVAPQDMPVTMTVDTAAYENGQHLLTVNLITRQEHLGTFSQLFWINKNTTQF